MRTIKILLPARGYSVTIFLLLIINSHIVTSQNTIPYSYEIINNKISEVIINDNMVLNEKNKKKYTDTVKFNLYGNLEEKKITAYDTNSERISGGDWTYTYDSLNNRLLETRKSHNLNIMDYFNYVYDSTGRIKKQIWVYWINMKLAFSRIYEVQYDSSGRLFKEFVEDGAQKLDSVFLFNYDADNHLVQMTCTGDKDFIDTINIVNYFYNSDGTMASTITKDKISKKMEEFTYDQNKKLIKKISDEGTTTCIYDKNRLLTSMETMVKDKKGLKYKYAISYVYR